MGGMDGHARFKQCESKIIKQGRTIPCIGLDDREAV